MLKGPLELAMILYAVITKQQVLLFELNPITPRDLFYNSFISIYLPAYIGDSKSIACIRYIISVTYKIKLQNLHSYTTCLSTALLPSLKLYSISFSKNQN